MSESINHQIRVNMAAKSTTELLEIWIANDRTIFSNTAFEEILGELRRRGVSIPDQMTSVSQKKDPVFEKRRVAAFRARFLCYLFTLPALASIYASVHQWELGVLEKVLVFFFSFAAVQLYLLSKRLLLPSAAHVLANDNRRPILLLRSFADDKFVIQRSFSCLRFIFPDSFFGLILPTYLSPFTLEEMLEEYFSLHGPVIAIGRPGEKAPPFGAAREYVENDSWKARVDELLLSAQFVVLVLGDTEGVAWEFEKLHEHDIADRMIVVFPPDSKLDKRWHGFREKVKNSVSLNVPPSVNLEEILFVRFTKKWDVVPVTSKKRRDTDYEKALRWHLSKKLQAGDKMRTVGET